MKNSADNNDKVVQTKGGFTYNESERKALEDYLAQLAGDNKVNKPKTTTMQAKTSTSVNYIVKPQENITNKLIEPVINKSIENNVRHQVKPVMTISSSVNMRNSYVPNSNIIKEENTRNMIKTEVKPIIKTEFKPAIEKVIEIKKEEAISVQNMDRVDSTTKKYEGNLQKEQESPLKKETDKVNNHSVNKVQTGIGYVPVSNNTNINRSSLLSAPNNSKNPIITSDTPKCINEYRSTFVSNQNVDSKNSLKGDAVISSINSHKMKETFEIKELSKIIDNKNNKKDSNPGTEKKNYNQQESNIIKTNCNSNEKKNYLKERDVNLTKVNLEIATNIIVPYNNDLEKSQLKPIDKLADDNNLPNTVNVIVKDKVENKKIVDEEIKTNVFNPKMENKPIENKDNHSIIKTHIINEGITNLSNKPIRKIETNSDPIENNKIEAENSKIKSIATEIKDNKVKNSNEKNMMKSTEVILSEKRLSMLDMMNKLDLKLVGARNSILVEPQVNNQPIITSASGKLDMSKKILELTKHMTGEEESNKPEKKSAEISTNIQTNTSSIPSIPTTIPSIPAVPSIIPSIRQAPKIPKVPQIPKSIPNPPGIPSIPGVIPKVPGIPGVPAIPKKPTNAAISKSAHSQSSLTNNSDDGLSISEQIAKGIALKKVENNNKEGGKNAGVSEKKENQHNLNMFEEMKKIQLKKVNK